MERLFELYKDLYEQGVYFFSKFLGLDGDTASVAVTSGARAAIYIDIGKVDTVAAEKVIVAHEWGHISTGALHPVGSPPEVIARDEHRATCAAIRRLVPPGELAGAIKQGYSDLWSLADLFNVSPDFMAAAAEYYNQCGEVPFNFNIFEGEM